MIPNRLVDTSKFPTNQISTLKGHTSYINIAKFSSDQNYCVSGSRDKSVIIWNPFDGKLLKRYTGIHNHEILDLAISKDNGKVASVGGDRVAFVWDVSTGNKIKQFSGHNARINTVSFNDTDSVLVTGSYDGTLRFWDMKQSKNRCIETISSFKDSVSHVLVDKHNVYVGSIDGYIRHLDLRAGEITSDHIGEPVVSMDLTADSKSLIVGTLDSKIRLWNILLGEELNVYEGHENNKYMIRSKLSKDNSFFVTGSENGKVYFYQFLDSDPCMKLPAHSGTVSCVDLNRKNGALLTSSHDKTLKLWTVK